MATKTKATKTAAKRPVAGGKAKRTTAAKPKSKASTAAKGRTKTSTKAKVSRATTPVKKYPAAAYKSSSNTASANQSGTRTSSRSAKRRSPKPSGKDAELLEFERLEFLRAIDAYKRRTEQTFPSWSEVLEVIRSIGWMSPARMSVQKTGAEPSA